MQKTQRLSQKKINGKKTLSILSGICLLTVILIAILSFSVLAEETVLEDPLTAAKLAGTNGPLSKMYNFFITISIPIAVVGLAMCVFSFLIPNEEGYKIAKKRLLNIGIAIMVIMIIPNIYAWATKSSVRESAWIPGGDNMQIIENASDDVFDITAGPSAVPESSSESEETPKPEHSPSAE